MNSQQVELLEQRVQDNVYDAVSWDQLVAHYQGLPNTHQHFLEKQDLFEKLVAVFPTAVGYWRQYAEAALAINDHATVKSIFGRCLLNSVNVELWNTYLRFIKKVNERKGPKGVPEIKQAFEFTLERVGQDIHAGAIYQEFLSFLQSPKPGTPAFRALYSEEGLPGQEDAHRIAILRKYYQKAVTVPTHHLDALWKAYESFEKSCPNKVLGKKLLEDMRSRYMSARRVYQERKKCLDEIKTLQLAVPPGDGGLAQSEQVAFWQQYLEFEKSNTQRLDAQTLVTRVSLAYAQALTCLVHHPEIWMDLARYHLGPLGGGLAAAIKSLERARGCLPSCLMLHFAMADILEVDGQIEKAKDIYEELVKSLENRGTSAAESEAEPKSKEKHVNLDIAEQPSLVWITYMRFLRRVENVKTSRELFIRATKSGNCPWSVYVAAALLEWRSSKEQQNSVRIFEKGMSKFLDSPLYVLQYIDFLLGIGDLVNARAVFERALAHEQCEKSQDLWEKYIQVLYETGDLKHAREVEERHRALLGDSTSNGVLEMVARYKFLDEWPFSPGLQTMHMKRVLGILPAPSSGFQSSHAVVIPRTQLTGSRGDPLKLPIALANFINSLPPIQGGEGPVPDVDRVLNVLLRTDLSPASVSQKCAEFVSESGKGFRSGVAPANEDLGNKKRKLDSEADGLYPGQQWEPSMDEYRLRMRIKRTAEEQQVAAARAAAKSSRSGSGVSAIEVP